LADIEKKKTGVSHPAMYFAVQGLFSGVATAISTGLVWVNLKGSFLWLVPWIIIAGCVVSVVMTIFLPKEVNNIGKDKKEN
jgi:Na+/melibiose symporter-like transporter